MGQQIIKPLESKVLQLEVLQNEHISPSVNRITVGGLDLKKFNHLGADQWFRMFFPKDGQKELRLPSASSNLWFAQILAMGKQKPWVRNYTVRVYRDGIEPELDVDIVSHGDSSPANHWANHAKPGDKIGLLDQGCYFNPPADTTELLLVADESGMPAIMGILETQPPKIPTRVLIEIPDQADQQSLSNNSNVEITWLTRKGIHAKPGELALNEAKHLKAPDQDGYTFVVGESGLPTGLRRYLTNLENIPKNRVTFVGYWKHGKAESM